VQQDTSRQGSCEVGARCTITARSLPVQHCHMVKVLQHVPNVMLLR
jgi:hypothetical protein